MKNIQEETKLIKVSGIKWDIDSPEDLEYLEDLEDLEDLSTEMFISIPVSEYNLLSDDELDEFISDKISDISGFCHKGWCEYSVS
jgi:hypothetical protein